MKRVNWLVKALLYTHQATPLRSLPSSNAHEVKAESKLVEQADDFLLFDVLFIPQLHANMCVDATEAMLNEFYNQPFTSMVDNPRGWLGDRILEEDKYTNEIVNVSDIKGSIRNNGPIMMSLPLKYNFSHSVLCVGFNRDHIIYHDPLVEGNLCIKLTELQRLAQGHIEITRLTTPTRNSPEILFNKRNHQNPERYRTQSVKSSYAAFFSPLHKDPIQALLNFLTDYAYASRILHPNRNYRDQVKIFLKQVKNGRIVLTIDNVAEVLNNELSVRANQTKGSLHRRIQTAKFYLGNAS